MKVIIPAAGLGTRLRPLTDACPKELLPVGGAPLIHGALLEAEAAGLEPTVVVGPGKERLVDWLHMHHPQVALAHQTHPRGTLDAVACGQPDPAGHAILYPDLVHLPDQTALATLLAARARRPEATWFALLRRTPESADRLGASAQVTVAPVGAMCYQLTSVSAAPGEWHTTLAEIRGPAHQALLDAGPLDDSRVLPILAELAARDLLYGVHIPGNILDLGIRPGHDDAVARFADGRARWRRPPALAELS